MNTENNIKVCPVEKAGGLDNSLRRLLQDPRKILKPYIQVGQTVLDLGCGPGFFTLDMARLLQDEGKVIAADLQDGMLAKVNAKIEGTALASRIELHKCGPNSIGLNEQVDVVLAFYMVHEVPSQEALLQELKSVLKSEGRLIVIEPKFHVSRQSFQAMIAEAQAMGYAVEKGPKVFFSRSVVLRRGA